MPRWRVVVWITLLATMPSCADSEDRVSPSTEPTIEATTAATTATQTTGTPSPTAPDSPPSVLVFSKTTGFRHSSIGPGILAIQQLGAANGFEVTATEDSAAFTPASLSTYDAVVFLSTTGDVLTPEQQTA